MLKPSVQIHEESGVMIAEFWDCLRLDPTPVMDLRRAVETRLTARGKVDLVIDLSGVGFAGSSALGGFVAMQKSIRQRGGKVVLCRVDPTVQEVFRVSKLDSLFQFTPDRATAVIRIKELGSGEASAIHDVSAEKPKTASAQPSPISLSRLRRKRDETSN